MGRISDRYKGNQVNEKARQLLTSRKKWESINMISTQQRSQWYCEWMKAGKGHGSVQELKLNPT